MLKGNFYDIGSGGMKKNKILNLFFIIELIFIKQYISLLGLA